MEQQSDWPVLRFSWQKVVFLLSIGLTGLGYFLLLALPALRPDNSAKLWCSPARTTLKARPARNIRNWYPIVGSEWWSY